MKLAARVGLVAVVVVGLGWGGLTLLGAIAENSFDDTSQLSRRVWAEVGHAKAHRASNNTPGYLVDYRYTFRGRTWHDDGWVGRGHWKPGHRLEVCVDPDHPAHNAIRVVRGSKCGDDDVNSGVHTAEPQVGR